FKEAVNLKGEREVVVDRVGDGSIIKLFDRTPPPEKPTDVVCPHFLELKWANGCYFNCAWCYLNGTYRFHPEWKNGKPNIKDFGTIREHLKTFLQGNGVRPEILNAGELSDSLLAEKRRNGNPPFSEFIINTLSTYDKDAKHKILFLTKDTNVKNLIRLKEEGTKRIIMSFSLNADSVAKRWEKKAPSVDARIKAARKVWEAGYTTRIRIDPIVPVKDWKEQYAKLLEKVFSNLKPERITLGSLRGLTSTITNAKDKSWVNYLSEKSNWGRKIDTETRYDTYVFIIKQLQENYNYKHVALCKETVEMWEKIGMDYKRIKCNCIL
ncbi:MAG: radical SAM protein, partial [Candidatus Freyarchaeota archaeon]